MRAPGTTYILALLCLLIATSCFCQLRVSEVCADYKHRMDSLMRVTYGDTLFENYFIFDTSSYIWIDNNEMYSWNQTFTGDSITAVEFWYVFVYPGAHISPVDGYRPGSTIMWIFEDSLSSYSGRCIKIKPDTVENITRKQLHKPLSDCYVTLYTRDYFSVNDYESRDLDTTHVYITVEYVRYKGSGRRGSKFRSWHYTILIDACTGEYIGKDELYTSGIVGGHF